MKLAFLELPPDERRVYFEQAAIRRNVSPVVVEKPPPDSPLDSRNPSRRVSGMGLFHFGQFRDHGWFVEIHRADDR